LNKKKHQADSRDNLSKKKLRWIWFSVLVSQTGLVTILLLFSIRSVWNLINKFLDKTIGLKEYSFPVILSILFILLFISVSYLLYQLTIGKSKKKEFSKAIISLFFLELFLYIAILLQLYPNLESMYFSQLPYWLFKENVLLIGFVLAIGLTGLLFLQYRKRDDYMLKSFFAINGVLFLGVFSFGYMAVTVRGSDFDKNSFQSALDKSDTYFQIDTQNTERFAKNSPNQSSKTCR